MAQKKLASRHQMAEIGVMLAKGEIDRDLAQAIIRKRVEIIKEPRYSIQSARYSAHVEYRKPSCAELEQVFDRLFPEYSRKIEFDSIDVCKDVSTESLEIEFELVHLNKGHASADKVLEELDKLGLRPALYEELLGFAKRYPDENEVVALGSVYHRSGGPGSPAIYWNENGRGLGFCSNRHGLGGRIGFLAVRKQ